MAAKKPAQIEKTTERIAGFSDAIFAFAMTLLMLDIKVPDIPHGAASDELTLWVITQAPKLAIYALSFIVIGLFWMSHHRMFHYIHRHDSVLMWLNMTFLLVISLLPFPTAILGEYGDNVIAVSLYAGFMLIAGMLLNIIWLYATSSHRLVREDLDEKIISSITIRGFASSAVFATSIIIAVFISPEIALWSWISILILKWVIK